MVQTVKERLKKFPGVVDGIFNSIDAISKEAEKILNRPELEHGATDAGGGQHENGTVVVVASVATCTEDEHHSLQTTPVLGGETSSTSSGATDLGDTFAKLNDLCRINNQLLIALGVGHPKIDQICTLLARYGIHPKMTGAGGGGSVFAFLKPDTSQTVMAMIKEELTKLDYELWQPPLGGPGLLAHTKAPALFTTPFKSK